ncbi:sel1-repeat-containing protein YbeT-like [Heteronotia binoei]|uniref:sel1-repeat-containing protein YbeT-like n=1 Tax=Heteronotia binoei TaxID=13085 RepID=UPI002930B7AC|nr:sel1-repeat-containing protein YbeT-like [Heteronotia binoei]
MKSVMVQRKRMGRSQTGLPAEISETNLSQRVKKPPSEWSRWELLTIFGAVFILLYILLCYENFHFHVAHMYAHLGYPNAQHIVGQRYLKGAGVQKNEEKAMQWFSQAAEQGHPHSSFNLAVGKLKNMTVGLDEREVEKLLSRAAGHGLQEAQNLLENIRNRNQP